MEGAMSAFEVSVLLNCRLQLEASLISPRVSLDSWGLYQLCIAIDGHGPAYRLPRQLLGMAPVAVVESILRVR